MASTTPAISGSMRARSISTKPRCSPGTTIRKDQKPPMLRKRKPGLEFPALYSRIDLTSRVLRTAATLALLSSAPVFRASDWLSYAANPTTLRLAKTREILNSSNVRNLKLIWKRKLDNVSVGSNSLTASRDPRPPDYPPGNQRTDLHRRKLRQNLCGRCGSGNAVLGESRGFDQGPAHCSDGITARR